MCTYYLQHGQFFGEQWERQVPSCILDEYSLMLSAETFGVIVLAHSILELITVMVGILLNLSDSRNYLLDPST